MIQVISRAFSDEIEKIAFGARNFKKIKEESVSGGKKSLRPVAQALPVKDKVR